MSHPGSEERERERGGGGGGGGGGGVMYRSEQIRISTHSQAFPTSRRERSGNEPLCHSNTICNGALVPGLLLGARQPVLHGGVFGLQQVQLPF